MVTSSDVAHTHVQRKLYPHTRMGRYGITGLVRDRPSQDRRHQLWHCYLWSEKHASASDIDKFRVHVQVAEHHHLEALYRNSQTMTEASTSAGQWRLETDRLVITRFDPTPANGDFLAKLYNTPEFIAGEGDTGIDTPEKGLRALERMQERFEVYGHGVYLISLKRPSASTSPAPAPSDSPTVEKEPQVSDEYGYVPVGSVSLMRGDYACPDIGFALLTEHTGKGYATEAAREMVRYATAPKPDGLGYEGVFGFTSPDNQRSRRAVERLGFEFRNVMPLRAFGGQESAVYTSPGMGDLGKYGIRRD